MPVVSDEYKQNKVRELHRATWKHIAERGVDRVTIDEILKLAGFTSGTMYNYFRSRDELVAAAIGEALEQLRLVLERAVAPLSDSPAGLFSAVIDSFAESARTEPFAMATASMVVGARPHLSDPHPLVIRRYADFVTRVEEHARHWRDRGEVHPSADPRDLAELMVSAMLGYFTQQPLTNDKGPEGHISALKALGRAPDAAG